MTSLPLLSGFALGASLIIAIGAQNAFVFRQGLRREHTFTVAALCAGIDAALIAAGTGGFGTLVSHFPAITQIAAWGGAAFLAVYGVLALRSAIHPGHLEADDAPTPPPSRTLRATIATTLAVSLLNPHVYLDTIVLLGSLAAQYAMPGRAHFALGAGCASVVWFFSLAFGARLLAPIFERPAAWRVLDLAIAGIMLWIAATLVLGQIG
ncbi:MAG: LysE/ArgO family amino acid transporter [Actinomycetota bacterium]|nr:LysE/ArgO family amino acid transporter [Actinomycetota bacterium]